ncbi:M48 family metallopeptidase [Bartonella sp. HY329]|uniref:M48 family metallopeptidase n=1 Tax=unclassified Bartonella TaxID=2645622 RepID=UPI0021C930F7|nr:MULTISPECIES: SprT family zinc-dependent metalloprotease [unclassified Bartonella]UXM95134.1 M48 family metallopeptidase [Bartonella sp. HY329]UXN09457.1 M48 family metallopeptidase [Bartonella sp. HY328]
MKSMFFKRKTIQEAYSDNFVLSDRTLPLKVIANSRAKRLTLRIESGGKGLKVTVPPRTSKKAVGEFLNRYKGWLETKLNHLPPPSLDEPMLKSGVKIPIFGKPHRICHLDGRGTTSLVTDSEADPQILVYGAEKHLPRRLKDFLIKQAELTITPLVAKYATEVGRKPKSIRFKDTTSRWGSCTSDGALSFSWRIMMAPHNVIDYLVAHEVSHLIEMNHSSDFWNLCEKLCPESKKCRAWLKRNGQMLHAIDFASN